MLKTYPIGIFDSGVGGLSILAKLRKALPTEDIIYLGDQKNMPYGEKSDVEIVRLTVNSCRFLVNHNAKIIILGCNTASVYSLSTLRTLFPQVIFVGTVPVVKVLIESTKTGSVLLLTTLATARSQYLADLIKKYNSKRVSINVLALRGIERLVEEAKINIPETKNLLRSQLLEMVDSNLDCVGLSCTHFIFLKKIIADILGKRVRIFDPVAAIVKRTENLLADNNLLSVNNHYGQIKFYTTGETDRFSFAAKRLIKINNFDVEKVLI